MRNIQTALVAVFLCLAFDVSAEIRIKFGGASFHTTSDAPNEFHRTAIMSHRGWFGGYFRNSFDDDSFAAGYSFTDPLADVDIQLHTGIVYGYRKSSRCYKSQKPKAEDPKIVCPLIAPELILRKLPLKPSIAWYGFDAIVFNLNLDL